MKAKVKVPGSCGELVQGTIDGEHFLVTCPIDLFSEVTLLQGEPGPAAGPKAMEAVRRAWEFLGCTQAEFAITVRSELPLSKGMASSSADIAAACQAAAISVGQALTADQIADIALQIEPTDGVFFPGIMMFDHVFGRRRQSLGLPPPMTLVVFDTGGQVDTLQFNSRSDLARLNQAKEAQVRQALDLVTEGLAKGDASLIGQGATVSAMANQRILFKACLPDMIDVALDFGAVGVNAAHSGTVIGAMFAGTPSGLEEFVTAVRVACPQVDYLGTVRLIGGGLTVMGE